jgi:hypothetical protein
MLPPAPCARAKIQKINDNKELNNNVYHYVSVN